MAACSLARAIGDYLWPRATLAVGFDDQCSLCQQMRRLVAPWLVGAGRTRLDSAQHPRDVRLAQVDPARRLQTLHAAEAGRVLHGYPAVSALIRRTLLGPPLLPVIAALEFSGLGERLYQQVNRRRRRCPDGCRGDGAGPAA